MRVHVSQGSGGHEPEENRNFVSDLIHTSKVRVNVCLKFDVIYEVPNAQLALLLVTGLALGIFGSRSSRRQ